MSNSSIQPTKSVVSGASEASWAIANAMRGAGVHSRIEVVLAAYLLYKACDRASDIDQPLHEFIDGLGLDRSIKLTLLDKISEQAWHSLKSLVGNYDKDAFAGVVLFFDVDGTDKTAMPISTPQAIVKLAYELLSIEDGDEVADVGCGCGAFLTNSASLKPAATYYGYEINAYAHSVAKMRAELLSVDMNIELTDAFSVLERDKVPQHDKVFSNYPFGMKLRNLAGGASFLEQLSNHFPGISKATSSDWVFNALLCEMLKPNGKAIGIMTNGSTWNTIDIPMRRYFLERGLIEAVIALPSKLFGYTAIPTTMIIMSKGNAAVRLIDAGSLCKQGRRFNTFGDDDILQIKEAMSVESEYSRIVSMEELSANDYVLSLSRYMKKQVEIPYAVAFDAVIKSMRRGAQCKAQELDEMASDIATDVQYLMLANIQNGIIDDKLPYLRTMDPKFQKYCLKDKDLIISKMGNPYKVAVASIQEGQQIIANGNLYLIELDKTKVNPYYLKAFFESEQGLQVLKNITVGAVMPTIGMDQLRKVQIPLPPIEEQNKIADRYLAVQDEIALLKLKLEKAYNKLGQVFDEEGK